MSLLLLAPLLVPLPVPAQTSPSPGGLAHANGIKIGEVTSTSAVLWTRLTRHDEALDRLDGWQEEWLPGEYPWRVPGAAGELRFLFWPQRERGQARLTEWARAGEESDFCHQERIEGLRPATTYELEVQGRSGKLHSSFRGSFTTAPAPGEGRKITFTVSTCQDFPRRDDRQLGHRIYRSMLTLDPDFFVQTGDTLYYDKPGPFAKDVATARYKWNRLYALPSLRTFHAAVPSYWMHDDHDLLKNDCWPGQSYGELQWEDGVALWDEQVPQSELPYRTFRWGQDLQIWLPEGREFRSPNNMEDGPEKSILGEDQWRWLEESLRSSDATHRFYVSATPVVGPDRRNKRDNHANEGFTQEGERLRSLLSSIPGLVVINGDRHWQYHSIDPDTGLPEFGCGPASDAHAGGFRTDQQAEWQPFLRIRGGFLSVTVEGEGAIVRHHDVEGQVVHEVALGAG